MSTTLSLHPALWQQLEQTAEEQEMEVTSLIETALQAYLRQREREQIADEAQAYHELHPTLAQQYLGQYVAVHHRQVIDHDVDFQALHTRIRQQLGRRPVLIRRVEAAPERSLVFRSPILERNQQ